MAIDGVGVLAMDSGAGGMSDEAGRLVFSRDPSGTFIDGMVFGTSGGGENANLEVLCALPYELVRPHASASVLGPLVGAGNVKRLSLSVKYLDGEISVGRYDRVSGFLVEQARALVGGDAEYQLSAVVCRPGVAEQLDLSSDAFTPMVGSDGNAVSFSYQPCDRLRCVCSTNPQKGLGVFHVWTERGATYQAVLGPCAYERRPEKALTLPDELWSRNESWMRDFFEQETSDFLCLGVVSRRTNIRFVEGGGARG